MIHSMYDLLRVYYRRLKSCMWVTTQRKIDPVWQEIRVLYLDWQENHRVEVPILLIEKMDIFIEELYEIKQKHLNLGIPMKKEFTTSERLNKAIQ